MAPLLAVVLVVERDNVLKVDEVHEGVANIAAVLEVNGEIEKIIQALMRFVDLIKQHLLTWAGSKQNKLPNTQAHGTSVLTVWVYLFGIFLTISVVRVSSPDWTRTMSTGICRAATGQIPPHVHTSHHGCPTPTAPMHNASNVAPDQLDLSPRPPPPPPRLGPVTIFTPPIACMPPSWPMCGRRPLWLWAIPVAPPPAPTPTPADG